ncbi:MAG: hypothetical protein IKG80_00025 [Clostridia bacterium]|nr:hypothetical protein [Clostridia bacterium]
MTVQEVIARADALKPNAVPEAEKIRWLSTLEGMIKNEIIDTHNGWEEPISGGASAAPEDTLSAPPPYDDVYVFWIMAKIDFTNGEFDAYANSSAAFNNAYSAFADHVNRTKAPKNTGIRYG